MSTSLPVTTYKRFLTIPAGATVTTEAGTKHITADMEIAKADDGGVVLLIGGVVKQHFYYLDAQRLEFLMHGNAA